MSRIFLPPQVSRKLLEERAAREAAAHQALSVEDQYRWKREFDAELQRVDAYLQLVWCPDPAPLEAQAMGAFAGRWHVARHNPGAPMSLIPLVADDGGYVEPGSWVFDMLGRMDLWSERGERERAALQRRADAEYERRKAREAAERREELHERVAAIRDVRVSFNQDERWTQNAAGKRGRRTS